MSENFKFNDDYQNLALACLIRHHEVAWLAAILKPGYFTGVTATVVARAAIEYHRERGHMPSFVVLKQLTTQSVAKLGHEVENVIEYLDDLETTDTRDWQYVRDSLAAFARERAVTAALRQSIELLRDGKEPDGGYVKLFSDAVSVGQNVDDIGVVLHSDYGKVVDTTTDASYGLSTGYQLLDNVWRNGIKPGWLVVPLAPPKRFKCLGKGTKVIMFDGSLKKVEDIQVGDQLMGDDLTPRNVVECGSGHGPMYKVSQYGAMTYECNDAHLLCLVNKDGKQITMTAESFYESSVNCASFNDEWYGYARHKWQKCKQSFFARKIDVKPIGDGDWYGVVLDGNRKFLLEDGTVTHNTGLCINMATNMIGPSIAEDVVYYACEISQELAMMRALCCISGMTMDSAYDDPKLFKERVKDAVQKKAAANLIFKTFSAKQASISEIRAHLTMLTKELSVDGKPFKPKAVFIDYAETIAPENKDAPDYRQQAGIYVGARSLASQFGCTVIMPDRCNREAVEMPVPDMKSFQGAFEKAGAVDVAFGLCASEAEHIANKIRLFVFLNRHGKQGVHLRGKVDPERWRIEFNETLKYEPEAESAGKKRGGRRRGGDDELPDDLAGLEK